MILFLSVEEASAANRSEASALAKARAQIAALQADNLRMRDEVAESERALKELRKAYKAVCMAYGDGELHKCYTGACNHDKKYGAPWPLHGKTGGNEMNWKQRIVQLHIENEFEIGSVVIAADGPESLRATDRYGDSLVFWLDNETGLVYDEAHFPEFYAAWREKATQSGADPSVESTPASSPAAEYAPEDYDPCTETPDPFAYGAGFDTGAFVLCPDCGAMVQSGYGAFTDKAAADQYAREHCPKCAAAAKVARAVHLSERERFLRDRKRFLRDLETVVKKAQPAVQRLAFEDLGGPQEAVLILYVDTGIKVWTASTGPLYIAKSVMEALPD